MSQVETFPSELALFSPPPIESAIEKKQWVEYRPLSQLAQSAPIEFLIPAAGAQYVDLRRSLLHIKFRIVKKSGDELELTDMVAPVNFIMHSLFSQIDVFLQQQLVSNSSNQLYAYKAYIETILDNGSAPQNTQLQAQGYFKDVAGSMDDVEIVSGNNVGLKHRFALCVSSKVCDVEGPLMVDIAQQDRLILNGVEIQLKLWQNKEAFGLMSKSENDE